MCSCAYVSGEDGGSVISVVLVGNEKEDLKPPYHVKLYIQPELLLNYL